MNSSTTYLEKIKPLPGRRFLPGDGYKGTILQSACIAPEIEIPLRNEKIRESLKISIQVGMGIENSKPRNVGESFSIEVGSLFGWSNIQGVQEPMKILHVWEFSGQTKGAMVFKVEPPGKVVWSEKPHYGQAGPWFFRLKDLSGQILGSQKFEVTYAAKKQIGNCRIGGGHGKVN